MSVLTDYLKATLKTFRSLNIWNAVIILKYLVDQCWVTVFECEQLDRAGVGEGLVDRPRFPVHQGQSGVGHVMLCQVWWETQRSLSEHKTSMCVLLETSSWTKLVGGFQSQEITRCHSLTFGTAQRGGHPFVHDEQSAIQPRALHGHLDLFDAWVQGSLPGLFSGEDGVALAADLCGGRTNSSCSSCKSWGWKMDGRMDWSRVIFSQVYFVIKPPLSY